MTSTNKQSQRDQDLICLLRPALVLILILQSFSLGSGRRLRFSSLLMYQFHRPRVVHLIYGLSFMCGFPPHVLFPHCSAFSSAYLCNLPFYRLTPSISPAQPISPLALALLLALPLYKLVFFSILLCLSAIFLPASINITDRRV